MSRSLKKGPFVEEKLFDRIEAMNAAGEKKVLKTWSRASTIFPEFVGHTIAVHDGQKARPGICYRGHGRTQARRIRTYENLPAVTRDPRPRNNGK